MNPFDDPDGQFVVLVNSSTEYSLWPEPMPVPAGWTVVHGPGERSACLSFVDATWTGLQVSL